MKKSLARHGKYFFGAFLLLFFVAGRPVEFGQENSFFHGFLIKNPVIKVGLGVNVDDIIIRASSGMKVYEIGLSYRLLAEDVDEIHVQGHREKLTEKFALLIAQSENKEAAERLSLQLRSKIDQAVSVKAMQEGRGEVSYQVRVGDFLTRGEALNFIKKLNEVGVKEAWILREEVTEEESHPLWVMVNNELETINEDTVIYFVPSHASSFLSYNGARYRGIFVLRASPKGLVLINILNLENYLRGVVPRELAPDQFNSFEALKAQAVAARTYAIKNLGLYADLGFDLCDTPQCQVYGGLSAEHPLSNQAVDETKGEVALSKGKLINALYTSTCGGMTEDVENVFAGRAQPYLKSVECLYEKQKEWTVEGRGLLPLYMSSRNIERDVAFLISLGVIPPQIEPSFYREPVPFGEAVLWVKNSLDFLGKRNDAFEPEETMLDLPGLSTLLIRALQWEDRVRNLMLKSEVEFILKDFPPVRQEARDGLAYLMNSGIIYPSPDLTTPDRVVTRGELAYALAKVILSFVNPSHKGLFHGFIKNELEVEEEGQTKTLSLSPDVFLIRNQEGERSSASRLTLLGGEEISWIEKQGKMTLLEVYFPSNSNVLDRSSLYHRWQVRQSREELEKRISEYYPIGQLIDVTVLARGKSRRATELKVKGTESEVVVKGLKIRWVLGLRDTLFTVDREYGENEQAAYFTFSGRGWGHGVGLCQVGAFRMALAGAGYKDILKKYYRDINIAKVY